VAVIICSYPPSTPRKASGHEDVQLEVVPLMVGDGIATLLMEVVLGRGGLEDAGLLPFTLTQT